MKEKGLKLRNLLGGILTVALALPGVAAANPLPNMVVGEIDAIVRFCSRVDPRLEEDAERLRTALLRNNTAPGARRSAEYQQGYDLVNDALARVEHPQALAACGTLSPKGSSSRAVEEQHGRRSGDR